MAYWGPEAPCHQKFYPVTSEWMTEAATQFGPSPPTPGPCVYETIDTPIPMMHRPPQKTINVDGDGACLPRCISMAVYGTQDHHQRVRDSLVDFILKGPIPGETIRRDRAFQRQMNIMRQRSTWMGQNEIEALAHLLDTPIYSCVQQQRTDGIQGAFFWQRAPHESSPFQVKNDRGIYIQNANSHFQLVTRF